MAYSTNFSGICDQWNQWACQNLRTIYLYQMYAESIERRQLKSTLYSYIREQDKDRDKHNNQLHIRYIYQLCLQVKQDNVRSRIWFVYWYLLQFLVQSGHSESLAFQKQKMTNENSITKALLCFSLRSVFLSSLYTISKNLIEIKRSRYFIWKKC